MRMARLITPLFVVAFAGAAFAQVQQSDLTVQGDDDLVYIGIDNCEARVNRSFSVRGEVEGVADSADFDVVLTWGANGTTCSTAGYFSGSSCTLGSSEQNCGCLASGSSSPIEKQSVVIRELPIEGLCTDGGPTTVDFFLHYSGVDDEDKSVLLISEPLTITFDRKRPPAPLTAPTVRAAEAALEIDFDPTAQDAESFEICLRPEIAVPTGGAESGADAGAGSSVSDTDLLRGGFTNCRKVSKSSLPYRFGGLVNETEYEIVYASIDRADNRGPNSPPTTARPSDVRDFAEYYREVGGLETGGCAVAAGRGAVWFPLFALLLGGAALGRRKRS